MAKDNPDWGKFSTWQDRVTELEAENIKLKAALQTILGFVFGLSVALTSMDETMEFIAEAKKGIRDAHGQVD